MRMQYRHLHGSGLRSIADLILSKKAGSREWYPLRMRMMTRSRPGVRRQMPRRCKNQSVRAFARSLRNLLFNVGVILCNDEDEEQMTKPKGHSQSNRRSNKISVRSQPQRSIEVPTKSNAEPQKGDTVPAQGHSRARFVGSPRQGDAVPAQGHSRARSVGRTAQPAGKQEPAEVYGS